MIKITLTETGRKESERLRFEVEKSLNEIIEYIPKTDLIGIENIYITDKPNQWRKRLINAAGAYYEKQNSTSAYIEIFLSRVFSHVRDSETFSLMMPIRIISLAQTLFHEVGHHVERTKIHGIKRNQVEKYAHHYARELLKKYQLDNEESINLCFENLEKVASENKLPIEFVEGMKRGWEAELRSIKGNT